MKPCFCRFLCFLPLLERQYTCEGLAARMFIRCGYVVRYISWIEILIWYQCFTSLPIYLHLCEMARYLLLVHHQISSTLPTPPAPVSLMPWALDVWHIPQFWSEQHRLSWLGAVPARSYRMCMLDVFCAGQGWHSQGRTQQTHSFTASQNITGTLASHQQLSQSLYLTTLDIYNTSLPERADLVQVAATFFF